jgi:hypothetical protein
VRFFGEHFRDYADRYLLIGGAACDLAMSAAAPPFRATKDLDIVLWVEALDAAFVQVFWEFVRAGGYEHQEKSTGKKQFYRFQKSTRPDFPFMLELFSRQPDILQVAENSHLTPLPAEEEASRLSAILLDNDYNNFIRAGRQENDGVTTVGAAQNQTTGPFGQDISVCKRARHRYFLPISSMQFWRETLAVQILETQLFLQSQRSSVLFPFAA